MADATGSLLTMATAAERMLFGNLEYDDVDLVADELAVAHRGQVAPDGDWTTWLILAGRGFGKTRAGADWVIQRAAVGGTRIALIGATMADTRSVMVEGDAGLLARAGGRRLKFEPSRRLVTWPNGSTATLFSAQEPDTLRGPSFNFAWGDEAARWERGDVVLSNVRMALRLGSRPRMLLTTTPRPLPWLKQMVDGTAAGMALTRGRTLDNGRNLPGSFIGNVLGNYGGTRIGRQELDGEIIDDLEGALWTRSELEGLRVRTHPPLTRVVIGVDPPVTSGSNADACGIIVAGLGTDRNGYIIADCTVQGQPPHGWARVVAAAADTHGADRVVAEVNNGGDLVEAVLRAVSPMLPLRSVRAAAGKVARAEPIAALYSTGQVRHVGPFPALEDELCGLLVGGAYAGPGRSPDRADALVWALSELMLTHSTPNPGIRSL